MILLEMRRVLTGGARDLGLLYIPWAGYPAGWVHPSSGFKGRKPDPRVPIAHPSDNF